MLMAIDAGNTHTVIGVFDGERLRAHWRIGTRRDRTEDELGVLLRSFLVEAGLRPEDVDGIVVSSVVPESNDAIAGTGTRYFGCEPLFVGPGVRTGMPILYENPHEVGADRIVNAIAAHARHGAPVIVLDFGTATTFDVVAAGGEYMGGVIAPGIGLSADALFSRAARLHRVEIARPVRVIGRHMEQCLQSGLFHGYVALVEGLVRRIREELGADAPVVATGGWSRVFATELPFVTAFEPELTLDGLRLVWHKNRK
jgi:type III pantothenate kinase